MRRRSALGVIGGAVAAMAAPFSLGATSASTLRHWTSNMSLREKRLRAMVLCERIRNSSEYWTCASAFRHLNAIDDGSVVVRFSSKFPTAFSSDEYGQFIQSTRMDRKTLLKYYPMFQEIEHLESLSIAELLCFSERDQAREILTIAIGLYVGAEVCNQDARMPSVWFYNERDVPDSLVGVQTFGKKFVGWNPHDPEVLSGSWFLHEVTRGINDLKPSFALSELHKLHIRKVTSLKDSGYQWKNWQVLTGCSGFSTIVNSLPMVDRRHFSLLPTNSRINTGYLCPQTGAAIAGDSELPVLHGYIWPENMAPKFFTDGVTIAVTDDGEYFAFDFSTSIWFNKESLQNVIAFAVPKV